MTHVQFPNLETPPSGMLQIGLVSDTHRLLRPQACAALAGVDAILHAGDVGSADVIESLASIAPTFAIRGNIDSAPWAGTLPDTASVKLGAADVYMLHDLKTLTFDPRAAGYAMVMSGHSHMPRITEHDGVLYVNPGSIGPRRFKLPISMARLEVDAAGLHPRLIELEISR